MASSSIAMGSGVYKPLSLHSCEQFCIDCYYVMYNLTVSSMATILSLLLVVVHLLYILIVVICSMAIVCSLLLVVVHLLYISIVNIYSMATMSTCKYCWQQVRRCDYEEHVGRSCPEFPMKCVFNCDKYIARKMMKQHC